MVTYGDLFTGFGGASLGAIQAGLTPLWGIEYDAKIAAVANDNLGGHVITANILDVDVHTLPSVDVLHASPPCPNFSVAKTGGGETQADIDLARKVIQFVDLIRPQVFTLENVYGYRHSQSWHMIQDALFNAGYWVSMDHVNAADLGVPQTRQRMIVRAVRGGWVPYLPTAGRWVGWYEAIIDLIPTLPESRFAPWQLKRLPAGLDTTFIVEQQNGSRDSTVRFADEPVFTQTIYSTKHPAPRAFIVGGQYETPNDGSARTVQNRQENEPVWTVTASEHGDTRAWLIGGLNAGQEWDGTRYGDEPSMTITSDQRPRAWLQHGRVVAMTPRALARFQSFPDSYRLPDNRTLAAKGIGNAVPPLMYRRIIEGLTQ